MTHAGHAWAPTGTPGRCLEGVTPGSAGIFSALSYFVAETPIILVGSISTETTTYVILRITTAQNVYKCISIIRKAKKNEDGKLVFQRTYEFLPQYR